MHCNGVSSIVRFLSFVNPPCALAGQCRFWLAILWSYRTRRFQLWCQNIEFPKFVKRDSTFFRSYNVHRLRAPYGALKRWTLQDVHQTYSIRSVDYSHDVRMELTLTLALEISRKVRKKLQLEVSYFHVFPGNRTMEIKFTWIFDLSAENCFGQAE